MTDFVDFDSDLSDDDIGFASVDFAEEEKSMNSLPYLTRAVDKLAKTKPFQIQPLWVRTSVPPIPPCPENIVDFSYGKKPVVLSADRVQIVSTEALGKKTVESSIASPSKIASQISHELTNSQLPSTAKEVTTPADFSLQKLQRVEYEELSDSRDISFRERSKQSLSINSKESPPLSARAKSTDLPAVESDYAQDFMIGRDKPDESAFSSKSKPLIQLGTPEQTESKEKRKRSRSVLRSRKRQYSRSSFSGSSSPSRTKRKKLGSQKWNTDQYSDRSRSITRSRDRSGSLSSRSRSSRSRSPRSNWSSRSRSKSSRSYRRGQEFDQKFLRKDLKPEDLDLSKYDSDGKKIFVGNLNLQSTGHDLSGLFDEFGTIEKCYVAASGIFGFVVFRQVESAIAAVRRCNERSVRLHGNIIRVLMAKARNFNTRYPGRERKRSRSLSRAPYRSRSKSHSHSKSESDKVFDMNGRKVFIGRLPLSVKESELKEIFMPYGEVENCYIPKKGPGWGNVSRSMGVGFVIYKKAADAAKAVREKDQTELYGKLIQVKIAVRKDKVKSSTPRNSKYDMEGRKIHIRNIPYETLDRDLKEMFKDFGEIIEAYVPLTHGSERPMGYGFVTFKDARDADDAISHWNGKQIRGRKIVCEKAKPPGRRGFSHRRRRW